MLEDRPKLRPRRELLKPADLEVADDIVADLIEEELSVPDFMLAIAAATVGITVALIQRESYAPEDAASRALAVAELASQRLGETLPPAIGTEFLVTVIQADCSPLPPYRCLEPMSLPEKPERPLSSSAGRHGVRRHPGVAPRGAPAPIDARWDSHQLPRVGEAAEVANFRYDRDRHHQGHPAHCLKRDGDGCHRPARQQFIDLAREPVAPGFGVVDGMDIVLQHDLLRRMIEAHRGQPALIRQSPGAKSAVDPVMAQQKTLQIFKMEVRWKRPSTPQTYTRPPRPSPWPFSPHKLVPFPYSPTSHAPFPFAFSRPFPYPHAVPPFGAIPSSHRLIPCPPRNFYPSRGFTAPTDHLPFPLGPYSHPVGRSPAIP